MQAKFYAVFGKIFYFLVIKESHIIVGDCLQLNDDCLINGEFFRKIILAETLDMQNNWLLHVCIMLPHLVRITQPGSYLNQAPICVFRCNFGLFIFICIF